MKRVESTDLEIYTIMADADDNTILAGRGGGARMRRNRAKGARGTNMVSTTHFRRGNVNVKGTAKDCVRGFHYALSAFSLLWRNPMCARTMKRWTGQHASTTTGVQLDYGLWPFATRKKREKWGPRGTRQRSAFLAPRQGASGSAVIVFEHPSMVSGYEGTHLKTTRCPGVVKVEHSRSSAVEKTSALARH